MSWVCSFCGKENYVHGLIGRRPPRCRRCQRERVPAKKRVASLIADRCRLIETRGQIQGQIASLSSILDDEEGPRQDRPFGSPISYTEAQLNDWQERLDNVQIEIDLIDEQIEIARSALRDHRTRRALLDQDRGIYDSRLWGKGGEA